MFRSTLTRSPRDRVSDEKPTGKFGKNRLRARRFSRFDRARRRRRIRRRLDSSVRVFYVEVQHASSLRELSKRVLVNLIPRSCKVANSEKANFEKLRALSLVEMCTVFLDTHIHFVTV